MIKNHSRLEALEAEIMPEKTTPEPTQVKLLIDLVPRETVIKAIDCLIELGITPEMIGG